MKRARGHLNRTRYPEGINLSFVEVLTTISIQLNLEVERFSHRPFVPACRGHRAHDRFLCRARSCDRRRSS